MPFEGYSSHSSCSRVHEAAHEIDDAHVAVAGDGSRGRRIDAVARCWQQVLWWSGA